MTDKDLSEVVPFTIKMKRSDRTDFKTACRAIDTDMNKWVNQQAKKLILNHKKSQRS